ncbi:MAG: hypothetical protein ABI880_11630 [Acidobacteriota bacterium]
MRPNRFAVLLAATGAAALVVAPRVASAQIQAGCEPIVKAMNAEMNAPAFHRTVDMKMARATMKMEVIKVDGQLFRRMNDGPWAKMPMDAAALNQVNGELLKSGKLTLSGCNRVGDEAVGSVATVIYEYTSTMAGTQKPYAGRIWIGASDSLPYRSEFATTTQHTEFKGVKAPQ